MLKELLKNTRFRSEVKDFFRLNEDRILDIILFGSAAKGKENPKDIDIFIYYNMHDDIDLDYELKKKLESVLARDVEVTSGTYKKISSPSLKIKDSLFSEGISLISDKRVSELWGFVPYLMIRYELKGKSKSDRMRFYYSLYGRDGNSGIQKKLKLIKFSSSTVLCPVEHSDEAKQFFDGWKISITSVPMLIPTRFNKIL